MSNIEQEHKVMVEKLKKEPQQIKDEINDERCDLLHMIIGLSGEVGELTDAVKKHVIYNKELDRVNVIEELGDIEFFLQGLREALEIERDSVLMGNISKLEGRFYDMVYSDEAANERKDKQ